VLDRESSFADRDVIALLEERFVPVALDVWYEQRRQDPAGEYFRKVVFQREGLKPDGTTQGLYAFAPDGTLLAGWNNRNAAKLREQLRRALDGYEPKKAAQLETRLDPAFARTPPEGGLVVDVHSRILEAGWPKEGSRDPWEKIWRSASGFDHLWITKDEVDALKRGDFPASVATRIARFHALDNTRGEPPTWEKAEVAKLRIAATPAKGRFDVEGEVSLRSAAGDRGYDARLRGVIEVRDGRIVRFDLVLRGAFFGEGRYTPNAPPGRFTLGIAFTLPEQDPSKRDAAVAVPPQGARWLDDYFGRV
jgi:hypothetical protein